MKTYISFVHHSHPILLPISYKYSSSFLCLKGNSFVAKKHYSFRGSSILNLLLLYIWVRIGYIICNTIAIKMHVGDWLNVSPIWVIHSWILLMHAFIKRFELETFSLFLERIDSFNSYIMQFHSFNLIGLKLIHLRI